MLSNAWFHLQMFVAVDEYVADFIAIFLNSGVPRYTVKTGSSASKLGRSSRAKADSTCSHSVLSALMLLLLPSLAAEEPVFTVYLGTPLTA